VESTLVTYLLENGPISTIAGVLFWLWRREVEKVQVAEGALLAELRAQIAVWKELKEKADAS